MTPKEAVRRISVKHPWVNTWAQLGMVVCVTDDDRTLEIKQGQDLPVKIKALGCGGWNEAGQLLWVGLDFDVGHGAVGYETKEEAIAAARSVREFVGGAAEIRLSKSGKGVHVRVRIGSKIMEGRKTSGNIAKWLAKTLDIKADRSPLGRQNFWFWAAQLNEESFKPIEECVGWWTVPPAALKDPEAEAPAVPAVSRGVGTTDAIKRAEAYLAKVPGAIAKQGGHDHTFKVALQLVKGFGLTVGEARGIFYAWNQKCQPPWSEKELEHKLAQADRSTRVSDGFKLQERQVSIAPKPIQTKALAVERAPKPIADRLSDRVRQQINDEISGKRYAALWPWPTLTWASLALLPGTVTVICAPGGSAKSFFLLQCARFWRHQGYKIAIMELEETLTFYGRRALAQIAAAGESTDPSWSTQNPEAAPALVDAHAEAIDELGECMFLPDAEFNTAAAVRWVSDCVARGCRIIAIDPITAVDQSEKPWVDDKVFINGVKGILRDANCSLVLITHPPKNAKDTTLDNVAGGAAYQRFCQNIFYMQVIDEEEVPIVKGDTEEWQAINRKLYLRKLRNGRATNACIGFWFNPKTLCFEERGIVKRIALESA